MKKLISLVLALVMVAAIAVSASAITGTIFPKETTTAGAPIKDVSIKLVEDLPENSADTIALLSLVEVAANRAYIYNQLVTVAVFFKTESSSGDKIGLDPQDYSQLTLRLRSDVVEFIPYRTGLYRIDQNAVRRLNEAPFVDPMDATNAKVICLDLRQPDTDVESYVAIIRGVFKGAASGKIAVDFLGNYDEIRKIGVSTVSGLKFYPSVTKASQIGALLTAAIGYFGQQTNGERVIYDGKTPLYDVSIGLSNGKIAYYDVEILSGVTDNASRQNAIVRFYMNDANTTKAGSEKNVDKIEVIMPNRTDIYLVNDTGIDLAGGGASSVQFYTVSGGAIVIESNSTRLGHLNYIYSNVMSYFGLDYKTKGVLIPLHFALKFSDYYSTTEKAIAFNGTPIVNPDINLPPTGDMATTAGFVMIALAIVAASALAYRKVRG